MYVRVVSYIVRMLAGVSEEVIIGGVYEGMLMPSDVT